MIQVELKPLFARLNSFTTTALENAAGYTLSRNHYEITPVHFLRYLLEDQSGDLALVLKYFEQDPAQMVSLLDAELSQLKQGNTVRPVFSPLLTEWVQDAWLVSSLIVSINCIRSSTLLLALLFRLPYYGSAASYSKILENISRDKLLSLLTEITAGSCEGFLDNSLPDMERASNKQTNPDIQSYTDQFCDDLTARAAANKIDPVLGREKEIRQMIDILARRRKNNPVAVGEPGVGKSAVVEGLALAITRGEVPEFLRNTRLLSLDLGMIQAGAGIKGEFEKRLRGVIDEIRASATPAILFIDEAHMLIGAGGSAGGSDAANLLKPALARGELRTIAATTWTEYKKYFEKDPALARRFQLVRLDEPDVRTTELMLRGLKKYYENVHNVSICDEALVAAAVLADRYITSRLLPDKAIDLLDTACGRVRTGLETRPALLSDMFSRQAALLRELDSLRQDSTHGYMTDNERCCRIQKDIDAVKVASEELELRWNNERTAALRVLEARRNIAQLSASLGNNAGAPDQATVDGFAELHNAGNALQALQGNDPLICIDVNHDAVARVVSDWTGIPLGKVLRDFAGVVLSLNDNLKKQIHGQNAAIGYIAEILKTAQSGLHEPDQPLGVFLLTGPSGVGKTETAFAVADNLFGGTQSLISIAMSEYQESHSVSRLVGSPPGYVGYGEGGVLTEAVRRRPWSVVLLDEIEKAHPDVLNLFYQVFDKGSLTDGEGRLTDFSNTVIFLTSNLASEEIANACAENRPDPELLVEQIRPVLSHHFRPALLARMTVVPYFTLPVGYLSVIVRQKLERLSSRLMTSSGIQLKFSDEVISSIAARCTDTDSGARNIDFILRKNLTPRISDVLLSAMAEERRVTAVSVELNKDGSLHITQK